MARVVCRCGETLTVTSSDPDRVVCPRCGAKIRVRRSARAGPKLTAGDGYIRFPCPCGRRLKIREQDRAEAGRCPDCGRVVPVPDTAARDFPPPADAETPGPAGSADPGARTAELDAADLDRLERWARRVAAKGGDAGSFTGEATTTSHQALKVVSAPRTSRRPLGREDEARLRVCTRCGKPLHVNCDGLPILRRAGAETLTTFRSIRRRVALRVEA
ncbi:MAG: hypothetical protein U0790_10760 [Isosphaeraceae bacterium]